MASNNDRIDTGALLAKTDLVSLVESYLPELKKKGREYVCCCPFHGERTPSFAVVPEKGFYHCHGCGAHGTAIDFVMHMERLDFLPACEFLGAERRGEARDTPRQERAKEPERVTRAPPPGEPLPDMRLSALGSPARSWRYLDSEGALLGLVARYEYTNNRGETKKEIRQWTWGSKDGAAWRWDCLHWAKPRPLYGLDRMAARPDAAVLFSEGEKATDAAAALSAYVNAGWPGGTQAVKHCDWSPMKGRRALLWPDFDTQAFRPNHPWVKSGRAVEGTTMPVRLQPGFRAMMEAAAAIHAAGGGEIRIVTPRDGDVKGDGWDLADAAAEGMSAGKILAFARDGRVQSWPPPSVCVCGAPIPYDEQGYGGVTCEACDLARTRAVCGCGAVLTAEEIEFYSSMCERCEQQAHDEFSRSGGADTQPAALASDEREVMQSERGPELHAGPGGSATPPPSNSPAGGARRLAVVGGTDTEGNAARDTRPAPRASDLPPEYSDDAVSAEFTRRHADDLRYVATWGKWVYWTGQRWLLDETLAAQDMARVVCRDMARDAARNGTLTPAKQQSISKSLASKSMRDNVLGLACTHRAHASSPDRWDANPWMLNTPGGIVDLQTGMIRPGRPDDHAMKLARATPGGDCPEWRNFLHVVTDGDTELQAFLQRVAGYSLTGSIREQVLIFAHGSGGNGKGVFLNTLQWILGDYAQTAPMSEFMASKTDQHSTGMARMAGARLVVAQETEEGRQWAESKVKALTGGDPIPARFIGKDFFEFQPQFKLLVSGNNRPEIRTVDHAIRRRFNLVPFEVTVKNPDMTLPDRLRAEGDGIMAWCLEGCLEWQRIGLAAPDRVKFATEEYLAAQDSFADWMDECTERDEFSSASAISLYRSFRKWADLRNEPELTQRRFGEKLKSRGVKSERDARGCWTYTGIKVRNMPPESAYPGHIGSLYDD